MAPALAAVRDGGRVSGECRGFLCARALPVSGRADSVAAGDSRVEALVVAAMRARSGRWGRTYRDRASAGRRLSPGARDSLSCDRRDTGEGAGALRYGRGVL